MKIAYEEDHIWQSNIMSPFSYTSLNFFGHPSQVIRELLR